MNARPIIAVALAFAWMPAAAITNLPPANIPARARVQWVCTMEGQTRIQDADGSVAVKEMTAVAGAPLHIGPAFKLLAGLSLRWDRFDFDGVPVSHFDTYVVGIPLTAMAPLAPRWSGLFMVAPAVHTDFKYVDGRSFRPAVLALATWDANPRWKLSLGAFYSRLFGSDRILPGFSVNWTPTPEWQVALAFPRPQVVYAPRKDLRFSVTLSPAGDEWTIREPVQGVARDMDFQFKGYRIGVGTEYDVFRRLTLEARLGAVLFRRYTLLENDVTVADAEVQDTWFVQAGVAFR